MSTCTDEEFIAAWYAKWEGSPTVAAKALGVTLRAAQKRRESIENRCGVILRTISHSHGERRPIDTIDSFYHQRRYIKVTDGRIVIFSDAHWWPKRERTPAHEALLKIVKKLKPFAIVANGDVLDGASISRHDPMGWENRPPLVDEIGCVVDHMRALERASPDSLRLRTIGNHDIRFDKRLAMAAPEYKHLTGTQLRDHLPRWLESMSVVVNDDCIIKHRWHNGIHATYNNTLKGGVNIVTGHLHQLMARPHTDYRGRRWGIDCGTLAALRTMNEEEPNNLTAQFEYAEDNPLAWGSGFAVLTWRDGILTPPEFCEVIGGKAWFRGEAV